MLNDNGVSYELYTITGTGHNPMIEQPEYFNRVLEQILQKVKREEVN